MARAKSNLKAFLQEVEAARLEQGRNTLAAWFRVHHDELLAELGGRPIEWDLYLAVFAKRGLKDADGNTPTKTTASKTWHRVRAAVARERAQKSARTASAPKLAPDEIAHGVRLTQPIAEANPATALEPPRARMTLDIRPAQPLTAITPQDRPSAAASSSPGDAAAGLSAKQQIKQAMDALGEKQTPMPRIVR